VRTVDEAERGEKLKSRVSWKGIKEGESSKGCMEGGKRGDGHWRERV
jgi:hypothetical protein